MTNLGLREDGTIAAWGPDLYFQVTNAPKDGPYIDVEGGSSTSAAIRSDGTVVTWGAHVPGFLEAPAGAYSQVAMFMSSTYLALRSTPCTPDCDGDGALNIDDFICFMTSYALDEAQADCDGDGALTIDDFLCFQTAYALGC